MVTLLEQINTHGDFKEDVSKWELKALADQTWAEFKSSTPQQTMKDDNASSMEQKGMYHGSNGQPGQYHCQS